MDKTERNLIYFIVTIVCFTVVALFSVMSSCQKHAAETERIKCEECK